MIPVGGPVVALDLLHGSADAVQHYWVHCHGPVREGVVLETPNPKP